MGEVVCRACQVPVEVWSAARSFWFWALSGGVVAVIGAVTIPIVIGVVILPVGLLMALGAPVWMLVTRGTRRCGSCKQMWTPSKDPQKAA